MLFFTDDSIISVQFNFLDEFDVLIFFGVFDVIPIIKLK